MQLIRIKIKQKEKRLARIVIKQLTVAAVEGPLYRPRKKKRGKDLLLHSAENAVVIVVLCRTVSKVDICIAVLPRCAFSVARSDLPLVGDLVGKRWVVGHR